VSLHGSSYGGLLVGLALGRYDLFHRGALVSGIAHLPTFLERTDDWRQPLREAEYGSLADDRALLERLSPRSWVDEIDGPVYIAHGENDPRTPVEDARQFADSLADAGVKVTELYFTDEGHGVSDTRNARELYRGLIEFFSAG
jgi:dipeptidyl aminopeptidase/acylaminoacyl peptidase